MSFNECPVPMEQSILGFVVWAVRVPYSSSRPAIVCIVCIASRAKYKDTAGQSLTRVLQFLRQAAGWLRFQSDSSREFTRPRCNTTGNTSKSSRLLQPPNSLGQVCYCQLNNCLNVVHIDKILTRTWWEETLSSRTHYTLQWVLHLVLIEVLCTASSCLQGQWTWLGFALKGFWPFLKFEKKKKKGFLFSAVAFSAWHTPTASAAWGLLPR